ncbi:histidine phosphatase super family protein [Mycolicibacterium hassiacum DSM 44199]|uniref:Histidine phosphatase super family protein n=1 Tax=Mycolicibacterium hassiacum (strain DSM 44199 / CIP 105218 / JCM 12690 / 3849) TaxID=1122247 RepID=K5BE71_MYCHD|nr:histidine phosphatase family protein [Mycolicibacterium hassiacum]EKF22061.1 histidine phosphatase super family protein [Mycolicibacterium hassiacum DSM 44199]MBX5488674.1 histidine phosphatase family protein [Mycolicibacterium hassiacum]MDA4086947.1 histidine phosphatase [Mycolicibacterium hassiacum DSM 44199]VCT92087.1 Phosphoserine phosphatase 1 [Mycolicibacterium hassiacum DSM 44199]
MTEVLRLALVSHAMTDAMSAGRFPTDEALNVVGRRQLAGADPAPDTAVVFCGPERRTRQTAELLGLRAEVDQRLADLDHGRWRGLDPGSVPPTDLTVWLTDPSRAPHGGEAITDLIDRVRGWMTAISTGRTRVVAVTHPAVVRAAVLIALDAPARSFWRVDVAPASRTELHFRGGAWTLRLMR